MLESKRIPPSHSLSEIIRARVSGKVANNNVHYERSFRRLEDQELNRQTMRLLMEEPPLTRD